MDRTDTSLIEKPSMTRREMLTGAAAAAVLCGESTFNLEAESQHAPPNSAQVHAFLALWLLLAGRGGFFVIQESDGGPSITCPHQDKIAADLHAFFTDPATEIPQIIAKMKELDPDENVYYYKAFRSVRSFFEKLGTGKITTAQVYVPGEVCGRVKDIMAVAGVRKPKTAEAAQ